MSKIGDKLIEIEELLLAGHNADTVAKLAGVPINWVTSTELELMGMTDFGYEEENAPVSGPWTARLG